MSDASAVTIAAIKEALAKANAGPTRTLHVLSYDEGASTDAALLANAPTWLAFLLSELEAREADTRRLDWMEEHGASVDVGDDDTLPCTVQASDDYRLAGKGSAYKLREAIDAAMRSRPDAGEGGANG